MSYTNLIGYDLFNEPCYNEKLPHTKQEICELVAEWYNIIKMSAPDHLVTIGTCWDDVSEWDPAVLKVDFLSPHLYPATWLFDETVYEGPILAEERTRGAIHWIGNNSPLPWIIGEIGFMARSGGNVSSEHLDGTIAEQQTYAQQSLDAVRNCGGSGYSWWFYHDVFDGVTPGNFFGLLERDISCSPCLTAEKAAATIFKNYPDPAPAPDPLQCIEPSNYRDPYNHGLYNTSFVNEIVSGTLVDQNSQPIKNAIVGIWDWLQTTVNPDPPFNNIYLHNYHYTFTDAVGEFDVIPYNYLSNGQDKVIHLKVSGIGLKIFETGGWEDQPINTAQGQIQLDKFNHDESFDNITVNIGQTRNFKSWQLLTVSNITVDGNGTFGGISDFFAQDEVNIDVEFHAKHGSDVHIYNKIVYPDCSPDLIGYRIMQPGNGDMQSEIKERNEILLTFNHEKPNFDFAIIPNPNSGSFRIVLPGDNQSESIISIYNSLGLILDQVKIASSVNVYKLEYLPKGVYSVNVTNDYQNNTKKLIIN